MMHLLVDTTKERFDAAVRTLAVDQGVCGTCGEPMTTTDPNTQRFELSVGDATCELSADEIASIIEAPCCLSCAEPEVRRRFPDERRSEAGSEEGRQCLKAPEARRQRERSDREAGPATERPGGHGVPGCPERTIALPASNTDRTRD